MTILQIVKSFSKILTGGVISLAWISCNESAPLVVSEDILSPSIILSNLPNDFSLSIECKSYTDTLDYSVSFGSDSLFRGLEVSGAGTGTLMAQILGPSGLLLQQDSGVANTIQSKHLKSSATPRQVRLIFRAFTGRAAFTLIAFTMQQEPLTIFGAWEWIRTSAEAYPGGYKTPGSEGYTCQLYFMPDSTFAMFRDDTILVCRGTYATPSDYQIQVTRYTFPLYGLCMEFYMPSKDDLIFHPAYASYPVQSSTFHRRMQ